MNTVIVGATSLTQKCAERILAKGLPIAGIVSSPKAFSISYSKEPVVNVQHSDMQSLASKNNIPYYEIGECGMKDKGLESFLEDTKMDFMLVAGWYHMVPRKIRELASRGAAGIHASLLPKYRGGAPLVWALINGEEKTGVSLFYLEDGVDKGGILAQKTISIKKEDTIKTLYDKVNEESISIVGETLPKIISGEIISTAQNEDGATHYPQRSPKDGLIDWNDSPEQIYNWVRAQTRPYPGAFTYLGDDKIKIWSVDIKSPEEELSREISPGTIFNSEDKTYVKCSDGFISLTDYEVEDSQNPRINGRFRK